MSETVWTDEEIEQERKQGLEAFGEAEGNPGPGSFSCHEALHMAAYLVGAIDRELCDHRSILENPRWFKLALEAQQKLADLYQAIGAEHLSAEDPNREALTKASS
jgi:hypothetical protein